MMDQAAEVVRSGSMSLCQTSKRYNIPKTTLHDRVKNKFSSSKIGLKTMLTPIDETQLEQWALHMSRIGYGRARKELAHVVMQIIAEDGRKTLKVDGCFFARHPSLNLRTTVQLGKERSVIMDASRSILTLCAKQESAIDPSIVYLAKNFAMQYDDV
ncbi:hypothetical protein DPMN_016702 [Dreissena polymorpha]|uniref:HTH psq-type domain-containing protein n=1 Tax=Dreissena polymorpha TaxID=45954 RepID=A0A9D4NA55_DREPO|nr:hypothetical protein DPMN_016702 [Dreissena polymorpha]